MQRREMPQCHVMSSVWSQCSDAEEECCTCMVHEQMHDVHPASWQAAQVCMHYLGLQVKGCMQFLCAPVTTVCQLPLLCSYTKTHLGQQCSESHEATRTTAVRCSWQQMTSSTQAPPSRNLIPHCFLMGESLFLRDVQHFLTNQGY